jgi:hypothetical protein
LTTFVNYAHELEDAVVTLLLAEKGESGTMYSLNIKVIETEKPQPDGGPPELYEVDGAGNAFQMPYIGVSAMTGKASWIMTRTLGVEHEIRLRCLCDKNTAVESRKLAQDMANLSCKAIIGKHGEVWGSSNCQVLIGSFEVDPATVGGEDNPYLAECIGTVRVTVVHTD